MRWLSLKSSGQTSGPGSSSTALVAAQAVAGNVPTKASTTLANPSQSPSSTGTNQRVGVPGQLSQRSPKGSPSVFSWPTLSAVGQLSQALPSGSPSLLSWLGLAVVGQLSQISPKGSPSAFSWPEFSV